MLLTLKIIHKFSRLVRFFFLFRFRIFHFFFSILSSSTKRIAKKKKGRKNPGSKLLFRILGKAFFPGSLILLNPNFFHRLVKFSNTIPRLVKVTTIDSILSLFQPPYFFQLIILCKRYKLVTIHRPTTELRDMAKNKNFSLQYKVFKFERMVQLFTLYD